ncbi:MAG TPA: hypothetical protein VEG26_00325 [Steroidobacteraceae bacterium]|nr:hypothetical protein [Steroidobacteraceae bacterium]
MNKLLALSLLTAVSAGFAVSANAACVQQLNELPQAALRPVALWSAPGLLSVSDEGDHGDRGGASVVGTWHVTYTTAGAPGGEAFIQWHSDGTEWENINFPILGGNICMGSWKSLDATHVYRYHVGWLYNDGVLAGHFIETETDVVSWDGNSYSGHNETKLYDLAGNLLADLPGTAKATRIKP